MSWEPYQIITAGAALWAAGATTWGVIATLRAPKNAAEFAAKLEANMRTASERKDRKFSIFLSLMQDRANLVTWDSTRALNLIDVVFSDCREVRDAWHQLHSAFETSRYSLPAGRENAEEKTILLLEAMANNLGFATSFSKADFERRYLPIDLFQQIEAQRAAARALTQGAPISIP
jgi:hypothetical protein